MTKALQFPKTFLGPFSAILLLSCLIVIFSHVEVPFDHSIAIAVAVDIILIIPLIYFSLIRKTSIPKTTTIPLIIIGVFAALYFLPSEATIYLSYFKDWVLPILELAILGFILYKVRSLTKQLKRNKQADGDFMDAVEVTCKELLPAKVAQIFITEIGIIYYGFFYWKTIKLANNEFSYHKNSGTLALFGAFILIIAVETFALHYYIAQWNTVVAWVLTILSIYTGLQLFGYARAIPKRPIQLTKKKLHLKYGMLAKTSIPLGKIEAIELSTKSIEDKKETISLSPIGEMEGHTVLIHLKESHEQIGFYGMKKPFKSIAVNLDEPHLFASQLEEILSKNNK